MSMYFDPNWQHCTRGTHVAVFTEGSEHPEFMTLVAFAAANSDALDELASNAEGHDVTAKILDGEDLILGGGAAPTVRVTLAIRCQQCGVMMTEFAEASGFCQTSPCWAVARCQEIERTVASAEVA